MRINKYIASCAGYSRRKSEELVLSGRIKINNEITRDLSTQVSESDKVYLDGKLITLQKFVYYALNKPVGYTTTTSDPHAKKLITELVPKDPPVFPVGRLDKNTSGLIFLTNDGDFAQKMTHPKYEKEKEYIVETNKPLSASSLESLREGIELDDGMTAPAKVTSLCHSREGGNPDHKNNLYSITIHEGKNRQIRRMVEKVGAKVMALKRIRIGDFELGDLKESEYQIFTQNQSK
ncbi:MAG: pseudouridine synthase [Patescibacteria group bacterium]